MEPPYINLEYIYYKIYTFFSEGFELVFDPEAFFAKLGWLKLLMGIICIILAHGLIINLYKIFKANKKELTELAKVVVEETPEERAGIWDKIKRQMDSDNPSDWRLAILEADSLIDTIIKKIGYEGETFGERLSNITPSQFKYIDDIWEVHKLRNRIAHRGAEVKLTKDDAREAMDIYTKALEELDYI